MLIVGLGNPGERYAQTRHNAGFWFVDGLAAATGGRFRFDSRCQGETCRVMLDGHDCHLLKPATFMNRSGQSLAALSGYYRIPPSELLVVHDELDLPPGIARLKQGGGHGGHNGLRDIIAHVGKDFLRLRIGIGHPGHGDDVTDYVLSRASGAEQEQIESAIQAALGVLPLVAAGELQEAMNKLHSRER